jgi:hypothetical protein
MIITYSESLQLRGLAILMMVWLHCFNKDVTGLTYTSLLPSVGGATVPFLLTRVAQICVSLYCFLSGYGLYSKYPYAKNYTTNKAFTLTKQYWFVLLFFCVLSYFLGSSQGYSFHDIMGNFLGYRTTWNSTLWFMLPYVLLLMASKWIFVFINRQKWYVVIPIIIIVWITAMWMLKSQKLGVIEINVVIRNILQAFRLLLPFCIGAYCKKYDYLEDKTARCKRIFILISIVLILSRFLVWNHFTLPICCVGFVYLYHCMNVNEKVQKFFSFFGKKSLFLWFCHAYFVYYYLKEYTFAVKYAILIYTVVITYSLLSTLFLEFVYKKVRI